MKLRIPPQRRDVLFSLSNLSDTIVKELFAALANVPAGQYGPDLPLSLSSSLTSLEADQAQEIVDTLLSLYPFVTSTNRPVNDFVEEIVLALRNQPSPSKTVFSDAQLDQLRVNLQKLLKVPSMSIGAKATGLLFENERSLLNSRVITDIRPVFQMDSTDIGAAVILHTLKLEYAESGDGDKEFFIVLDSTDIDSLIANLERAKEKGQKLKGILKNTAIPLIDPGEI